MSIIVLYYLALYSEDLFRTDDFKDDIDAKLKPIVSIFNYFNNKDQFMMHYEKFL